VERALAAVMDDLRVTDTLNDLCSHDLTNMQDVPLTGGTFSVIHDSYEEIPKPRYGAGDESAKLNVNVATREQLLKLPKMTDSIAGAIIDWRDQDEVPQPDGIEGGYYGSLAHPYTIRNGPLRTIRELLLVRGVTPELFYGEDTNVNGLLDPNENDGDASDPPDNADGRLDRGWCAYLTVYSYEKNANGLGAKRLNLKTADAGTLASRLQLEHWAAESIVKARERDELKTLSDLLEVKRDPSITVDDTRDPDINGRSESEKDQPVTKSIFQRIVDDLTLEDAEVLPGRININTAPREVLKTLPGVDDEMVNTIVQRREGDVGYASIADLLDVSGMTKEKFAKIENSVAVRSNVFRIYSEGRAAAGLASATIESVVDRGAQEVPRVLYWLESSP